MWGASLWKGYVGIELSSYLYRNFTLMSNQRSSDGRQGEDCSAEQFYSPFESKFLELHSPLFYGLHFAA
jgi:hypothetical protein